jgi:hypothetical protein
MRTIRKTFTLSSYEGGRHVIDELQVTAGMPVRPSFAESLSPVHSMIEELYTKGAKLGSKVEVTMTFK